MRLAALIVLAPAIAAASPPALVWQAPAQCPNAADARARIERRLGEPIDHYVVGISVDIAPDPEGYVAHVGGRTLTSSTCDDLTDAVALVVARLAVESPVRDDDPPAVVARAPDVIPPPPTPSLWSGGARLSFLSGVGNVPEVGFGGELAITVRRAHWYGEVAGSDWASTSKALSAGAPGRIDVHLGTLTFRAGYQATTPIRGWIAVDTGSLSGEGIALQNPKIGSGPWFAVGAGFGVAWPIVHSVRLVGTFEALVTLDPQVRFALSDGYLVYQPDAVSARTSFGLEIDWP